MNRREFLAAAAPLGVLAGVAGYPAGLFAGRQAQTIRGRVVGGERPLEGVLVSDGCRVTRTDPRGEYALAIGPDSGRFVFICTPRGHWADVFYVPIGAAAQTGRADFALRPVDQPDRFDFVFAADIHLERRVGISKFKASLDEINRLEPTPAFLWAQGDICLEGGMGQEYLDCLAMAKIPVRNGAGNHEMVLKHANPRDRFERFCVDRDSYHRLGSRPGVLVPPVRRRLGCNTRDSPQWCQPARPQPAV